MQDTVPAVAVHYPSCHSSWLQVMLLPVAVACCSSPLLHDSLPAVAMRCLSCCPCWLQVVRQAHAVVLASGTLSPIASLTRQLFPTLPPSAITHFACGHVVPKDRLLAIALAQVC